MTLVILFCLLALYLILLQWVRAIAADVRAIRRHLNVTDDSVDLRRDDEA